MSWKEAIKAGHGTKNVCEYCGDQMIRMLIESPVGGMLPLWLCGGCGPEDFRQSVRMVRPIFDVAGVN